MSNSDLTRFYGLRAKLFVGINKALKEDDGHHKSYEGQLDLGFPGVFDEEFTITCHCYVVGPGRHNIWTDKSLSKALDKFEKDLNVWLEELEEEDG